MELPISKDAALVAATWLKNNFGDKMKAASADTAFTVDHLCGIVCQESAYRWLGWRKHHSVEAILGGCVLDGSGDVAGAPRSAFPKNTMEFRAKYGKAFTDHLVSEGNKMRKLMGWGPVDWIYKGYGIFQFDLQYVSKTAYEGYFRDGLWYSFDECLARAMEELRTTWARANAKFPNESTQEKIRLAIKAYNGAGARAEAYSKNVIYYTGVVAGA